MFVSCVRPVQALRAAFCMIWPKIWGEQSEGGFVWIHYEIVMLCPVLNFM